MTTQGDQILDVTLSKIGGKGLFVKELETALEEGRADIAVHSLKDVPMHMPQGFMLCCIGKREDPRDAFVSNQYPDLAALPPGSVVGTSSLRRESQLRARFRICISSRCAATCRRACANWTKDNMPPSFWPPPD